MSTGALGIGDVTTGISQVGAQDYLEQINRIAIQEAKEKLMNLDGIKMALQSGWQGKSESDFETLLTSGVNEVCKTLDGLYYGLEATLAEIAEAMAVQDQQLIDTAGIAVDISGVGAGAPASYQKPLL